MDSKAKKKPSTESTRIQAKPVDAGSTISTFANHNNLLAILLDFDTTSRLKIIDILKFSQ